MALLSNNKLILQLDKAFYLPGESIKWIIKCAFTEPVKIEGLTLGLIGKKKYTSYSISSGSSSYSSSESIFFHQKLNLLWAWTYSSQDIPFEYLIPLGILPKRFGGFGKIGNFPEWVSTLLNLLVTLMGMRWPQYSTEFILQASADVPWALDINASVNIAINSQESDIIDIPVSQWNQTTNNFTENQSQSA